MFQYKFPIIILVLFVRFSFAQHLYYRHIPADSLKTFKDTINKVTFKGDTTSNFKHHFKYVLRFFPTMQYNKIEVTFKPSKRIAVAKPTFMCLFLSPEKRKYKINFSTKAPSALDSVTLKNLELDSQLGLIGRQVSHVEDLSTSGFFDVLFWYFKQISRKAKNKREYVVEQKVLEVGLGHQLLALSKTNEERLKIEKWKDTKAYGFYFRNYRKRFMDAETISNFINDLPVYASHQYR
ncbi:MAG: Protein of unknown function precursor [Bacteroidetes bacterium]|nr:Protein of unknown function precursor [Bacteroidota bacterium]